MNAIKVSSEKFESAHDILRQAQRRPLDPIFSPKTIAVIGYGIQGKAQAANARDSGFKVIIGSRGPEEGNEPADLEPRAFARLGHPHAHARAG